MRELYYLPDYEFSLAVSPETFGNEYLDLYKYNQPGNQYYLDFEVGNNS
jgi:hypothetical protein